VKMNWTICSLRLSKDWIAETIERERTWNILWKIHLIYCKPAHGNFACI
jgi:hypothetical protein